MSNNLETTNNTDRLKTYTLFQFGIGTDTEYTFVDVFEDRFSMLKKVLKTSNQKDKKWSKFLSKTRYTVSVKTPSYLGFPVINVFKYGSPTPGARKKLINISNSLPLHLTLMSVQEQVWFLYELESLVKRNGLETSTENLIGELLRLVVTKFNHSALSTPVMPLYSRKYQEITDLYLHPLIMHVDNKESADLIKFLPCSRARNFDDLVSVLKIKNKEKLTGWVKEKYETRTLNASYLFLLTVCTTYSERDLLSLVETIEYIYTKVNFKPWSLVSRTNYPNHSAIKGLTPKVEPKTLLDMIVDAGEKSIKNRNQIVFNFPSTEVLNLWSKHYRQTKPIKAKLKNFDNVSVSNYLVENINNLEFSLNEEDLLTRINNLKLVTEPVSVFSIPAPYNILFAEDNRLTNTKIHVKDFLKRNYLLYEMLSKVSNQTDSKNRISYIFDDAEKTVMAMEKIDSYITRLFSKRKVAYDVNIAKKIFILLNRINSSSVFPAWQGRIPSYLVVLVSEGIDFDVAATLLLNKVSYKEIKETLLSAGNFKVPEEWIYDIYNITTRYSSDGINYASYVMDDDLTF